MSLQELKTSRSKLIESLAEHTDDAEKFSEIKSQVEELSKQIDAAQAAEKRATEAAKLKAELAEPEPLKVKPATPKLTLPAEPKDSQLEAQGGFEHLGQFARAVHNASLPVKQIDERLAALAPSNYHNEGSAPDGYMVPPAFSTRIFELMFHESDLLSMVDTEEVAGNQGQLLADETTPWGATGVQAAWGGEGAQFSASRLDTEGRMIRAQKLHAYVLATEELLEDAPMIGNRLTRQAARALNYKANDAIINGAGTITPLGFTQAGCLVTQAAEGSQTADTINSANIGKMYGRMMAGSHSRAVWLINPDSVNQLFQLTVGDQPVWTPPNQGFTQAPGGFLMGRPVMLSEHCQTLGDAGDIYFIDPKGYYLIRKAGGIKSAESIHLFFDYDVRCFRWTLRLGGTPYLQSAITPDNSAVTQSHFVRLAARA